MLHHSEIVSGFSDTLSLFKKVYPDMTNYKQETLVKNILGESYDAHNAMADISALQVLCNHTNVTDNLFLSHGFSTLWLLEKDNNEHNNQYNLDSLAPAINTKAISIATAKRIAYSGLNLSHLKLAYKRGGYDGLKGVFCENVNGSPRVSKVKL